MAEPVRAPTGSGSDQPLVREILLFVLLPLLFLRLAGQYVIAQDAEFRRAEARGRLADRLGRIVREGDSTRFFARIGDRIAEDLRGGPVTSERFLRLWQATVASFGVGFDAYAFDASGTLLMPASAPVKAPTLVAETWRGFRGLTRLDDLSGRHDILSLFGNEFDFPILRLNQGTPLPIFGSSGNGLVFWDTLGPGDPDAGFLLAMWDCPPPGVFLESLLTGNPEPGLLLCGVDPEGQRTILSTPAPGPTLPSIPLQPPAEEDREPAGGEEWIWAWDRLGEMRLIAGEAFSPGPHAMIGRVLDGGLLGTALLLAWALALGGVPGPLRRLPLRSKLSGMFLYLTGVGLAGLAALGFSHLRERGEVMAAQANRAGFELLARLDQGMVEEKANLLKLLRDFMADPDFRTDPARMLPKAVALDNHSIVNWLECRNLQGDIIFTTQRADLTEKIGVVGEVIARRFIDLFLGDRLPPQQRLKIKPAELIIQSTLDSPITGWSRIINHPDFIHEIRFGNYDLWWYWNYFRDPRIPAAIVQGDQKLERVIRTYLERVVGERRSGKRDDFRIAAWNLFSNKLLTEESPPPPALTPFLQRMQISGEPLTERFLWAGDEFLIVGLPGKHLKSNLLAAWYPVGKIDTTLAGIRNGLGLGMALAVLVALTLGAIFTDAFLTPLRELMRGVAALRARDVSVRVKVDRADEFGELGRSFNRTIEEIGELLYAQTVQNRLIPAEPPPVPGYRLAMANRPASDLGGDFCDIVPLPDGRVLFAIGDVTGHGVSSALVMAMAKAVLFSWSRIPQPVTVLMERLNRLFFRLLRRQKLMTFFVAILSPADGRLEFTNAGHPLPFLLGPDGPTGRLEVCRAPLGFSERAPFEVQEGRLPPHGTLVFFTDGLIELPIGAAWGSEGLGAFLEANRRLDPEPLRDALLQEAQRLAGAETFPDDVTLIVVHRPG